MFEFPPPKKVRGGGNHYAKIQDIIRDPFTNEPLVIVFIPVTQQEKVLSLENLQPDRKQKQSTNNPKRTGDLVKAQGIRE